MSHPQFFKLQNILSYLGVLQPCHGPHSIEKVFRGCFKTIVVSNIKIPLKRQKIKQAIKEHW